MSKSSYCCVKDRYMMFPEKGFGDIHRAVQVMVRFSLQILIILPNGLNSASCATHNVDF